MTSLAELQEKEYRLLEQLLVVKQMQEQQQLSQTTTTQDSTNATQHASNAQPSDVQTIETTSPAVTAMAIISPSTSSSHQQQQQQQQQQVDSSSAEALPHASIPRQPSSGIVATPRTTPLRQRGDSVENVTGHDTQRTGDDGQHQERDHEGSHVRAGSAESTPSARSNAHATPAHQSSSALVGMGSLVPESGGAHGLIVLASPEHNESRMMIVRDGLEDRVLETPPHFPHVAEAVGSVVAALQDDRDAQERRLQEAWAEVEAQKDRVGAERAAVAEERTRLAGRLYKGKHRLGLRALKWPLQEVPPDCSPNSEPFSDHSSDRLSASSSDVSSGGHEVDRAGPAVSHAPAVLEAAEPQAQQGEIREDMPTALQPFEGEDRGALQAADQSHSAETEWQVLGKAMGRLVNDLDTARTTQDDEVRAAWADLSATREEEVLQQRQQVAEERLAVVRAAWAAGDPEALDAMCWPMDEIPPSPPARKKKKDAERVADESATGERTLSGLAEEQRPVEPPLMTPETTTNEMERSVGSQGVDAPPADRAQHVRRGPGLPLSPSEDLSLRPVVDDDDATPPPEQRPELPRASSTPPAEEEHHTDRDVQRSVTVSQYSRPITGNDDDDDDGDVVLPPQHVRSLVQGSDLRQGDQQRALNNGDVRDPTVKHEGEVIDLAARSPSAVSSAGFHSAVSEVDPHPPHEDSVAPAAVIPSMDAMGGSVHSSAAPLHANTRSIQQGHQQASRSDSPSHGGGASSSPVSSTSTDVTSTDASAPPFGGSQQQSQHHHHRSVSQHSDDNRLAQRLGGGGDATAVVAASSSAAVSERAEFGTPVSDQLAAGPVLIDAGSGVAAFGASGGRSTPPRVRQDPMCLEQQLSGYTRFDDPWRAEVPSTEIPNHAHEHQRPQETSPTPQLVSISPAAASAAPSSTEDGISPGQAEGTGWGMMDTSVGTGKQSISTSRNSSRHSTRHSTPTSLSDAHHHRSAVGVAPAIRGSSLASSQSGRSGVHVAPTGVANAGGANESHGAAGVNLPSSATSVASRTSSAAATPTSRPPVVPASVTNATTPERWTPPPVAQYERPNRLPDAWRPSPAVAGPSASVNAREHQYSSSTAPTAGSSASQLPPTDAELLRTRDELFPHGITGGQAARHGAAEEQQGYTAHTALTPSVATLHGSRSLAASAPPVLADGRLSRSPFRARSPLSAARFHGAQLNDGGHSAPTSSVETVETGKEGKKEPRSPGRVSPRRSQPIGPGHTHGTVLGNPYLEPRPGYAETHAARLTAPPLSTVEASTTGARSIKTPAGDIQQRPPHASVASVAPGAPVPPAVVVKGEEKVAATPAAHDHPYMQQTPLPPYRPLPHRHVMTPAAGGTTLPQSQPLTGTTVAPQQQHGDDAAQRRAIQRPAVTSAYPQASSPQPTAPPQVGQASSVSPSKSKPQSPFSSPLKSQRFAGPSLGAQSHHRSPNYESPARYLDSSSREPIESGVMADPLPLHRYYSPDQMEKERLRRQRFIAATTAAHHDQQQQQQEQKAQYHQQDGSSNRTLSPQQSSERRKFGVGHYYQSPPQQRQQGHAPHQGVQPPLHRTPERNGSERRPRYSDRLPYSPSSGVTLRAPKASSLSPRGNGGGVSAVVASPTGQVASPDSVATGVDRPAAAARAASQSPPRPMRRTSPSPGPPSQDPVVQAQEQLVRRGFRVPMPRSPTSRSDPADFPQDGIPSTTPSATTAPRPSSAMKTGGQQRRAVEATEEAKRTAQATTTPRTSSTARSHSDRRSRRPVSPSATADSFGRTKQGFREMLLQQRALLRQREQERHAVESHDCSTGSDDIDQSAYVGDITPPHHHHHRVGRSLDSSVMTSPQRSPSEEKGTQTPPHRDHRHHSARDETPRDVEDRARPAKTDQARHRRQTHHGTVSTLGYTSSDTSASSVTNDGDTRRSSHGGGKSDVVGGQRMKDNNGPRENSDKDSRGADGNFRLSTQQPEQQQRLQSGKPPAASSDRVGQAKRPYQRLVSAQQQQQQQQQRQQQQQQQRPDLTKRHEEEMLRRDDGESHQQRVPTEEVDSPALSAAAASTGQRRLFPNPQRPYHTLIDGNNNGQTNQGRDDAVDPRRTNTSASDVRSHDSVDALKDGNVHSEVSFDRSADRESDGSDSPAVIARKAAELLRRKRAEREVREFAVRAKLDQFTAEFERDAHDNGQEGRRHDQRDQPRPSERRQTERTQSSGSSTQQQQQLSSRQQGRERYGRSTSADSDAASVSSSVASTQPPSSISSDSTYLSSVRSDRHPPHVHKRNDVARSGAPGSGSGAGGVSSGGVQRPGSRSNSNGYACMYDAAAKRSSATAAHAAQQQQQQQQQVLAPTSTKYNNGGRSATTASAPTVNALRSSSVGSIRSVVSSALTARAQVNAAPVSPPWIVVWSGVNKTEAQGCRIVMTRPIPWHMVLAKAAGLVKCQPAPQALYTPDGRRVSCLEDLVGGSDYLVLPSGCKYREESVPTRLLERIISGASSVAEY